MIPGQETYHYQSEKEAEKSALEFKIDQLEESINLLQVRIENIPNPNKKRPLEIQLDKKKQDIQIFKEEILKLEKEINAAENDNGLLN